MIENSSEACNDEVSNGIKTYFDVNESFLYFQDVPENENVLQNFVSQCLPDYDDDKHLIRLSAESEKTEEFNESHKIYSSLRQYSKPKLCNSTNGCESSIHHFETGVNQKKKQNQSSDIGIDLNRDKSPCFSQLRQTLQSPKTMIGCKVLHCQSDSESSGECEKRAENINKLFSKSMVDLQGDKTFKKSSQMQPRVILTNIFEHNEDFKSNLGHVTTSRFPCKTLYKNVNKADNSKSLSAGKSANLPIIKRKLFHESKSFEIDNQAEVDKPSKKSKDNVLVSCEANKRVLPKRNKLSEINLSKIKKNCNNDSLKTELHSDNSNAISPSSKVQKRRIATKSKLSNGDFNAANNSVLSSLPPKPSVHRAYKIFVKDPKTSKEQNGVESKLSFPDSGQETSLSLIDILKRYSEKGKAKDSPWKEEKNQVKNSAIVSLQSEVALSSRSSLISQTFNDDKLYGLSSKELIKKTDEIDMKVSPEAVPSEPLFERNFSGFQWKDVSKDTHLSLQNGSDQNDAISIKTEDVSDDPLWNIQNSSPNPDPTDTTFIKDKDLSKCSMVSDRMQTRIQTKSLPSNKVKETIAIKTEDVNDDTHLSIQNSSVHPNQTDANVIKDKNLSKCSNVPDRMQTRIQTKSLVSKKVKELLNLKLHPKDMSSKNARPATKNAAFKSSTKTAISSKKEKSSTRNKNVLSTDDCETNNNIQSEHVSSSLERNSAPPNFSFPIVDYQGNNFNGPKVLLNSNNSFVLGSPFMQLPSQGYQFPVFSQFPVQQPHFPTCPLNSFVSPAHVTYPLYQATNNIHQSNVNANSNLNFNSIAGTGSFASNSALNPVSSMNFSTPVTGSRKGPIIIHNTTSTTHMCTSTETVNTFPNSKQFKNKGSRSIKNIIESDRSLCVYDICNNALRFMTENESFAEMTVKEFYLKSPLAKSLNAPGFGEVTDFDDAPKVEYVFEDQFEENPIREVIKDYVSFHLDTLYKHPASKDHFIKKAFKNFPFRDCSYLCESLPKDNEILNHKDVIMYLSHTALLVIFDECKKRNIPQ